MLDGERFLSLLKLRNKMKKKKIFLLGRDSSGWSIDNDRKNVKRALLDLGLTLTVNPFSADIFYVVWWNKMFKWSYRILNCIFGNRIWIVTATNELDYQKKKVEKVDKRVDFWVIANQQQKRFLLKIGRSEKELFLNPFYVDEKKFKKINLSKAEVCKRLEIDQKLIENKFLIGSFQKDSLGVDLTKPKWQKGTELLRDIVNELKQEKIILVLAGPRRHFLIKECRRLKIPFIFVGEASFIDSGVDDCTENNLPESKMNLLYNLIDLYLVTSKSEGGPKAVIEAPLTETAILSTKVGLAPDFLDNEMLCETKEDFAGKIRLLLKESETVNRFAKIGHKRVSKINNYEDFRKRVESSILNAKK